MESLPFAFYIGLVSGLILMAVLVTWWHRRSNWFRQLKRAIRKISGDALENVVVPDGLDGEIHIEHLLLTDRGLLVLDVKQITGRLYGGDNMDEWTVINGSQRFTFANPAGPLRERVIAIKTLLKDVPVEGRVVLLGVNECSAGMPDCVVNLDRLQQQFLSQGSAQKVSMDAFYPYWDQLRQIVAAA